MGRTACTEPQRLYKDALYHFTYKKSNTLCYSEEKECTKKLPGGITFQCNVKE